MENGDFSEAIAYGGQVIDTQGLHKSQEKIKAVSDALQPNDVLQLRYFLGFSNYFSRFV